MLVGTKDDMVIDREVEQSTVREFALARGIPWLELSVVRDPCAARDRLVSALLAEIERLSYPPGASRVTIRGDGK
jgi:hypothetical protein